MNSSELKIYLFFVLIVLISSCEKDAYIEPSPNEPPIEEFIPNYSFFVAGHTYGHPVNFQYGLHPPFANQIPFINNYPKIELGVLTGDVVPLATQGYWDSAFLEINEFSIPIYIAAGNHDRGPVFETISEYYYSFNFKDDLFIILSPTNWNIEGDQKDFLIATIESNSLAVNNIYIFCHELVWWSPENEFQNVKINYPPHYPGSSNYWSEINPILDSLPNHVVIFAGDMGATSNVSPYMYYKKDNITLIGSGMGGGEEDNFIIIEVNESGELRYNLLGINDGTPVEMAKLEDYELP